MTNLLRVAAMAATAAAMGLSAASASAATPDKNATATARILKPLTLTWVQDLNMGDITLTGAGPFSVTVSLDQDGTLTCPAAVTCSGTTSVARYNVAGTQAQRVLISAPNVTLTNSAGNTLLLTTSAPAFVDLSNSGAPGNNFNIGGSIPVTDTTPDGIYTGTFNVTANYQ